MEQDTREIRIRNSLYTNGFGVVLFGFWSAIKVLMQFAVGYKDIMAPFDQFQDKILLEIIVLFIVFIIAGIDVALRTYVGTTAMAVARGMKRRNLYLILAVFFILISCGGLGLLSSVEPPDETYQSLTSSIGVSYVVELTNDLILIGMIVSALRLKKCEGSHAD